MVSVLALQACASTSTGVKEETSRVKNEAQSTIDDARRKAKDESYNERDALKINQGKWVGDITPPEDKLPDFFFASVRLASDKPLPLLDVAENITAMTGVPTEVSPDVQRYLFDQTRQQQGQAQGQARGGNTQNAQGFESGGAQGMTLDYYGALKGLLDTVAARFGVYWRYNPKRQSIEFYRWNTRTFTIHAVPGDARLSAALSVVTQGTSQGSSSGDQQSGSEAQTQTQGGMSATLDVWQGIEAALKAMLSSDGKIVTTPATGTITITDTPPVIDRAAEFVDAINAKIERQVLMAVKVYAVQLNRRQEHQFSLDVVYRSLQQNYGINMASGLTPISGARQLTASILEGSDFAGSQAIINALSEVGRVTTLTDTTITTMNAQPVPIQVVRQQGYLSQQTTTLAANVGSSTSLEQGMITTGFVMTVLPHLISPNRMMVQYSVDLSDLVRLDRVQSGDQVIQTPTIDVRSFIQRVNMKSGQTLVLSGFDRNIAEMNDQGSFWPTDWLFGGYRLRRKTHELIVVVVTPWIGARNP